MNKEINLLKNNDFKIIEDLEQCVSCHLPTEESKDKHIDYRSYYIEGAGQLCRKCFEQQKDF